MLSSGNVTGEMKDKLDRIARQVNRLIAILETIYGVKANLRSKHIHKSLDELFGENEHFNGLPLSQKALLMLCSLDEISCVLVGMRQNKYVDNILDVLKEEPVALAAEKWNALSLA
jgi:hypothetical protein